jgi:two-component system sensor histidine kinase KdpD
LKEASSAIEQNAQAKKLTLIVQENDLTAGVDRERLIQVMVNLLSNAINHSPEGESLTLEASRYNEGVEIRIIDHGPGVPPDYREAIFERFKQAPSAAEGGHGLGLFICKSIVTSHGGTLGVRDAEPKGSIFWFRIPDMPSGNEAAPAIESREKILST